MPVTCIYCNKKLEPEEDYLKSGIKDLGYGMCMDCQDDFERVYSPDYKEKSK